MLTRVRRCGVSKVIKLNGGDWYSCKEKELYLEEPESKTQIVCTNAKKFVDGCKKKDRSKGIGAKYRPSTHYTASQYTMSTLTRIISSEYT